MKRSWIIVLGVIFVLLVVFHFMFSRKILTRTPFSLMNLDETRCWREEQAREVLFNGIVVSKYKDKRNHAYETVEIENPDGLIKSTVFVGEFAGAYELVHEGDSLFKPVGELEMTIVRNGNSQVKVLEYGCKEDTVGD
ncbi:hypothetical protein LVD17_09860 [Fulvivirga ulvae]|uniref:hypothetical protein n=1 Tax=Fulvivirga ulvae TaxID=2904245 RepID=UPI001F19FA6B|nr:hypothetical protein [Fulvivirga ulvae]UII34118.1 hypothetical protein LVD17_09860 [Fulvivirga ulvae]